VAALVDAERFPLVVVRWPAGQATDEQVDAILDQLSGFYGRRHAVLYDGVRFGGMSTWQRARFAEFSSEHDDDVRRWVIAAAASAPSRILRGILNGIQRVAPSPCPFQAFDSYGAAEEWLTLALRRGKLWPPETMRSS
jgi:hypothetical protein